MPVVDGEASVLAFLQDLEQISESRTSHLIQSLHALHQRLLQADLPAHERQHALRLLLRESINRSLLVLLSPEEQVQHFDRLFSMPLARGIDVLYICVQALQEKRITQTKAERDAVAMAGFHRVALANEVVRMLQAHVLRKSKFGLIWRAIRDEEEASAFIAALTKCPELVFRVLKKESKLVFRLTFSGFRAVLDGDWK